MPAKTQRCARCNKHRAQPAWAPKAWGRTGKWCRSCRREHAKAKRAAMKSTKEKEAK